MDQTERKIRKKINQTQSNRRKVQIQRIKVGKWKTIETLINEEALLFAKYLRNEKRDWLPRVGVAE